MSDKITAIIFDLGGVIVDLAVDRTIQEFSRLSGLSTSEVQQAYVHHPGFINYEKGRISDTEFRDVLRELFSARVTDLQLDAAWNAMLVDLPRRKLQWLINLKDNLHIYALSNTNHIHINYVNEVMLGGEPLDKYFHYCYYSHHVHMRKPDFEIYEHVLRHAELVPHKTLFLDDNADNIRSAKELGLQAIQVNHPEEVYTIVNWL